MYVILFYDITEKEKSNARAVRKEVEKYLNRVQYSVFEGEIRESDLKTLKTHLKRVVKDDKDSIIIYTIKGFKYIDRDVIGVDKKEDIFS